MTTNKIWSIVLVFAISLLFTGCSKKAGIEGKVVDGKGQPMSGVKIIAKQIQRMKRTIRGNNRLRWYIQVQWRLPDSGISHF